MILKRKVLGLAMIVITNISFQPIALGAGVVGNGNAGSCTEAALSTALAGGGTVSFNCGGNPITIRFTNEKTIATDTLLEGSNQVTLSGNNKTRLFFVKPKVKFTLSNITLADGFTTDQGGAIHAASFSNSQLVIKHCKFINNVATKPVESGGGAIFSASGYVTVEKSEFISNRGSDGGAIRIVHSNLTVSDSTFTNNSGIDSVIGNGGAIHTDGAKGDYGKIIIRNSTFKGNKASRYGAAVFNNIVNNNTTTITDSVFDGNFVGVGTTSGQGGAIWSTGVALKKNDYISNVNKTTLTIVNSVITNNTASLQGGGIFTAKHPAGTIISGSTIANNTAVKNMGAGIMQADIGNLTVMSSTITGNKGIGPVSMGAGIYVGNAANAIIANCTISNNTANWQAGGIFGGKNVLLKNTILANNIALNGGNNWNIKHNCFEPMRSGGNNIQFPKPTDSLCVPGVLIADPKLSPLAKNGGLTHTMALQPGSAAAQYGSGCLSLDQRGKSRPNPIGTNCDSGAFEAAF